MRNNRAAGLSALIPFMICGWGVAYAQMAESAAAEISPVTAGDKAAPSVPSRVAEHIDETRLVRLAGNTHPATLTGIDKGRVGANKLLERLVLVLKRSPEQEAALAAFNERQYDPKSPNFHHWLHAEEFGKLYGPSDADILQVTNWLEQHGFQIFEVTKGRVSIQFTGTVKQVEETFHLEMHDYLVDGQMHIANDRDPSIPEALFPVITGIASLHDFRPVHFSRPGNYVRRNMKTGEYTILGPEPAEGGRLEPSPSPGGEKASKGGARPEFGYTDPNTEYQREELSPYDVATIYNILPLWNETPPINGKGVKVAIVGRSDIVTSDFNTYRSSFGLPAGTLETLHSGADPGITASQGENTEDTEMVSATAPGATVVLVADVDNATTNALITGITYIVDNEIAPILTMSYGECEANLGSSASSLFSSTFQQAATAGISSFVAGGDSGSAACTSHDQTPPYEDTHGFAVSGMASTQYATAVGGTDLQWPLIEGSEPYTYYWNTTNNPTTGASAKGYMPEMSWNDTCSNPLLLNVYTSYSNVEGLCNAASSALPGLVEMASGGGGASTLYTKPSWQTGVTGIPTGNSRYLPDVAMFGAYGFRSSTGLPGSALLICESQSESNGCDYSDPNYITYQENGGTSAASPLTAGIMALIVQNTGSAQGLANPEFYKLASEENYSACNSNTVAAGNACIFYDTTTGSNAAVCVTGDPDCVTSTSGDQFGILSGYSATTGYDLTTGLGTFNVANLVNAWPTTGAPSPATLTTPEPGSALTGSSATFKWTSISGSEGYWLFLGTTGVGSKNLFDSGQQSATSATFSSLPTDGVKIYARIYTKLSGTLYYNDYTYTAAMLPPVLTSPAPGSTLAGTSATFTWTAVTGGQGYWLFVGTTGIGSNNLYDSHQQSATSASVSGLPTDGGKLYVRVYTQYDGTLVYSDYTYTSYMKPPVLTSPTPGSTLSGANETFTWTAVTGGQGYWLFLGTTGAGSKDLYDSGQQTATSATFSGLPTNGVAIYARVYTRYNGVLVYNDYTYTSYMKPPVLTSPTPGSTLSGASETFTWTAVTGGQGYWLFLGTAGAGSKNLYDSGQQTVTSATFSGLPTNGVTIYARVFTRYNGVLVYNDYTYKAE